VLLSPPQDHERLKLARLSPAPAAPPAPVTAGGDTALRVPR